MNTLLNAYLPTFTKGCHHQSVPSLELGGGWTTEVKEDVFWKKRA